jgi:hypothetical protein
MWKFGWIGKWAPMFDPINDSTDRNWKIWLVFTALAITLIASLIMVLRMTQMPLKSYAGRLPALTSEQRETAAGVHQVVESLAAE